MIELGKVTSMADHPHTIDRWDEATGENLIERIAGVSDYLVALETYRAAVRRRSIANGVVASMRTSIRRISAPHAKHFIAAPRHPLLTEPPGGQKCAHSSMGCTRAVAVENCAVEARNQSVRI